MVDDRYPIHDLNFWLHDPLPALSDLRRSEGIVWSETGQFWLLLRYRDVMTAARTPEVFSSDSGKGAYRESAKAEAMRPYLLGSLLMSDPPMHTVLRRLVSRGFTPRALAQLQPRMRELARANMADIEPGRTIDVVHELAANLPATVICELLGIPAADQQPICRDVDACGGFDLTAEDLASGSTPPRRVFEYLKDYVGDRLHHAGDEASADDMITRISAPPKPGEPPLELNEIAKFAFLLLIGGTENVRGTMTRGIELLAHHPDQLDRMRREPECWPTAMEEIIRVSSTAAIMGRTLASDFEIDDKKLQVGQRVMASNLAANHDEEEFGDDADHFKIDRQPNRHLALGMGIHVCIGASLARLEMHAFFEELLARFTSWEVGPGQPIRNFEMFRAYETMPAQFHI
jgi:cytochrome P450